MNNSKEDYQRTLASVPDADWIGSDSPHDPLEITPLHEDMEAQLWAEVEAARAELRQARYRICATADDRFDRDHDLQQARARLDEAEEAWHRHITEETEEA